MGNRGKPRSAHSAAEDLLPHPPGDLAVEAATVGLPKLFEPSALPRRLEVKHPLDDEHGKRGRKEIHNKIET